MAAVVLFGHENTSAEVGHVMGAWSWVEVLMERLSKLPECRGKLSKIKLHPQHVLAHTNLTATARTFALLPLFFLLRKL